MTPVEVSLWAQAIASAPGRRPGLGRVAGLGLDHDRVGEERRAGGHLRELARELAVGEVQRALADQAGRGRVPEGGRAAVAERDLVAVGRAEAARRGRRGRAPTRSLTGFWRCEVPITVAALGEPRQRLGADLRGAAAEAAVGGLELVGDRRVRAWGRIHRRGRSRYRVPGDELGSGERAGRGRRIRGREPRRPRRRLRIPQDPPRARRDRVRRQRDRAPAGHRDRLPHPRAPAGALLRPRRARSRSSSATATSHGSARAAWPASTPDRCARSATSATRTPSTSSSAPTAATSAATGSLPEGEAAASVERRLAPDRPARRASLVPVERRVAIDQEAAYGVRPRCCQRLGIRISLNIPSGSFSVNRITKTPMSDASSRRR